MTELAGKRLGDYQFGARIGPAARSESAHRSVTQVYHAVSVKGGEAVAIKVFAAGQLLPEDRNRLRDSLRAVSQLRHPGIVPILGSGVIEGQPYIVMPYLNAGSLADRYERGLAGSIDGSELLNQLATVLELAHQRGIAHGSLKPSCLMFDPETGNLRLVGLGELAIRSARSLPAAEGGDVYASPEVDAGQVPTPTADQYSFGVLAAELLTGLPAEEALAYLRAQSVGRPHDHRGLRAPLPSQVGLVLSKSAAAHPGQRFATIGEANRSLQIALGKLAPVVASEPAPAPIAPRGRPRRRRAAALTLALLLLGLIGIVPVLAAGLIELPAWAGGDLSEPGDRQIVSGPAIPLPADGEQSAGSGDATGGTGADPVSLLPGDPSLVDPAGAVLPAEMPTATPGAGSELPGPTATPVVPTPTVPPTATSAPTNTPPPTAVPTNPPLPTPDNKKCKSDPLHPNYCTPTP